MKNLTRLTVLVVILAALTLATGIAFASGAQTALNIDLRGNGTPEDNHASATPTPSSMSVNGELEIIGVVESLTSDTLVISGIQIAFTQSTEFEDSIAVGDTVKVHAYTAGDGALTAREVELYPGSDDDLDDDSSDDDLNDDSGDDDSDDDDLNDDHGGSSNQSESGDDKGNHSGSDD